MKQISNSICTPYVEKMAKEILDALLAQRIKAFKQCIAQSDNKALKTEMNQKLDKLQQAYSHEFYKQLLQQTTQEIMSAMQSKVESAEINLINAEYFNLTGRLK